MLTLFCEIDLSYVFLCVQNLIDLAGSESSKAETTGVRRKEGSYINKSLLTLGTVRPQLCLYFISIIVWSTDVLFVLSIYCSFHLTNLSYCMQDYHRCDISMRGKQVLCIERRASFYSLCFAIVNSRWP